MSILSEKGIYGIKITNIRKPSYKNGIFSEEDWKIINIGGRAKYCLQISMPIEGTTGKLVWLEAGKAVGDYSLDGKEQKSEKLVYLTHLGITLAKDLNRGLQYLELQDNAGFDCEMPDGRKIKMNATDHDLVFYQQSYYEKRYGALLKNPQQRAAYEEAKKGFTDPKRKDEDFDFGHNDLYKILMPLYIESKTWKEFFDKINKVYNQKKCTIVYLWLQRALAKIMNGVPSYSGFEWTIDISEIPRVKYELEQAKRSGGSRKTKTPQKEPILPEIWEMDWISYARPK